MAESRSNILKAEPKLVRRRERHYVAIRRTLSMQEISKVLPPLIGAVFAWLGKKGVKPAGAPF